MGVRKITENETIEAYKIISLAFNQPRDFSDAEAFAKSVKSDSNKVVRAYFDEDEHMTACLQLLPFLMRFDGHDVKMGGIANVASLPELRRKGYVRKIFSSVFEELYAEEFVFSYLYPFSHPYYRQFGYELGAVNHKHTVTIAEFASLPAPKYIEMIYPGKNDEDVYKLYERFIADKNLSIKRRNSWVRDDPYKTMRLGYLLRNAAGEAEAYINFSTERNEMRVHELIWKNIAAMKTILGIANKFSHIKNVVIDLPEYIDLRLIFGEPWNIKTEIDAKGMNRIINVTKALEMMTKPQGEGRVTISVKDAFAEWNTGVYKLEWDDVSCHVTRSETGGGDSDMECGINRLTQLVTGFKPLSELEFTGEVEVRRNEAALSKLFVKKRLHVTDYF